jgi:hypothetical protein
VPEDVELGTVNVVEAELVAPIANDVIDRVCVITTSSPPP